MPNLLTTTRRLWLHEWLRPLDPDEETREFPRKFGADGQTRTADRRFTKPLLYQLSYVGADFLVILACSEPERDGPQNRWVFARRHISE